MPWALADLRNGSVVLQKAGAGDRQHCGLSGKVLVEVQAGFLDKACGVKC